MGVQLYYGIKRLTYPVSYPVTDAQLKDHCRLTDNDSQLSELQAKARYAVERIEERTKRVGLPAQFRMTLSRFPIATRQPYLPYFAAVGHIFLPRSPVISVDSVSYTDTNNVVTVLDPSLYQYELEYEPARLAPARLLTWPWADPYSINAIKITFTAGYADIASVPEQYKEAVKFLAAYRFFNRVDDESGKLPDSLRYLISSLDIGWQD